MEEVKKPSFVVYEVEENESLVECIGLSEQRSDELTEIVKDAHSRAERLSEAADLMSRYANNATELWYMAFLQLYQYKVPTYRYTVVSMIKILI